MIALIPAAHALYVMSHSFSNHFALHVMIRVVPAEIETYAQAHSKPELNLRRALQKATQRRIALSQSSGLVVSADLLVTVV